MPFPDPFHQSQHEDHDQDAPRLDPDQPAQPTAAASDDGQSDWRIPGWQWASLVAVLLGGQTILLVLTVWTLAASASHGWPAAIILALGLLVRLIPDTLSLAEWAVTADRWTPPIDQRIHLGMAVAALVLANLVAIAT
jgi:hypothetical protein